MLDLLKNTYNDIENIRGKRLIYTLLGVFISFIFIGILVGYYTDTKLKNNETTPIDNSNTVVNNDVSYEGIVTYIGEGFYSDDKISYVLTDTSGNEIVLLLATDDKLAIVEGLRVEALGRLTKTKDGVNDVLIVKELILKNAAN